MISITSVKPLKNYTVEVGFNDGTSGFVDLSHLRGKGVFAKWDEPGFFESVTVEPETGTIAWPGGIDLCPDVLYSKATGRSFEEVLQMSQDA